MASITALAERTVCGIDESKQIAEDQMIKPHPRLRVERSGGKGSKAENIYIDKESMIDHVTIHPSAEEHDLRIRISAAKLCHVKRLFYISVGQMKHFKIEIKLQVKEQSKLNSSDYIIHLNCFLCAESGPRSNTY